MKIEQKIWTMDGGWETIKDDLEGNTPQFVLVFGGREQISNEELFNAIKSSYSDTNILLCSTAGEIAGTVVRDGSLSVCAIYFEKTRLAFKESELELGDDGEETGAKLAAALDKEGLKHVMVFSDGLLVNGTSLVKGITKMLPPSVSVTGGLVGDGIEFKKTVVGLNMLPESGKIVIVGFYGEDLRVCYGSLGGWDVFGQERTITKSTKNVVYEIDSKPALELYKTYLGEVLAKDLPGSGLLFPLNLLLEDGAEVVRTLLAVDEVSQSMTFAGDLPEGSKVSLMRANFDRLIEGAAGAAGMCETELGEDSPDLAILISCVGRKLVLKDRVEDETEAVNNRISKDDKTAITGFYSYGEISPVAATEKQCRLHNQTMTITTFKEV